MPRRTNSKVCISPSYKLINHEHHSRIIILRWIQIISVAWSSFNWQLLCTSPKRRSHGVMPFSVLVLTLVSMFLKQWLKTNDVLQGVHFFLGIHWCRDRLAYMTFSTEYSVADFKALARLWISEHWARDNVGQVLSLPLRITMIAVIFSNSLSLSLTHSLCCCFTMSCSQESTHFITLTESCIILHSIKAHCRGKQTAI